MLSFGLTSVAASSPDVSVLRRMVEAVFSIEGEYEATAFLRTEEFCEKEKADTPVAHRRRLNAEILIVK